VKDMLLIVAEAFLLMKSVRCDALFLTKTDYVCYGMHLASHYCNTGARPTKDGSPRTPVNRPEVP
jgi:hypothetical protein